jgi:GNAT superfamily N-acetyltransferase
MTPTIRPAQAADVAALVELRLANARRHVELDPELHRIPDPDAVRSYFTGVLTGEGTPTPLILVADVSGQVAGMTELVLSPDPPDHQILAPRPTAQVHTVVRPGYRGQGIGSSLVRAAQQLAAERGVARLIAPIFYKNDQALGFYSGAGFIPHGVLLRHDISRPARQSGTISRPG